MFKRSSGPEEKSLLSRQEKRDIVFHVYLGCFIATVLVLVVSSLWVIDSRKDEAEVVEDIMNTVYSYMETATQEEYDAIAHEIRNDLILSNRNTEQWKYAEYIPNKADSCSIEQDASGSVSIVSVNTGFVYNLFEEVSPDDGNRTTVISGYDEISESTLTIYGGSDPDKVDVSVKSGRGIISVQKMKQVFCDDCIKKILEAAGNKLIPEFVVIDRENDKLYALEDDNTFEAGDCLLNMDYSETGYFEIEAVRN